jgi:hypothetical protein
MGFCLYISRRRTVAAERMLCEPLPRPSWLIEWVGFFAPPEAPPGDLPPVDVRDFLTISPNVHRHGRDGVVSAGAAGGKRQEEMLRSCPNRLSLALKKKNSYCYGFLVSDV